MRQVIRRKQEWRPSLASYQAQAYARRVLENEKGIVSIGELASEIYWERERGLREVVKSRRVTQNLEAQESYISAFAEFVNFYDDDIPFIGHTLIGPTHPDALKHYRFGLTGKRYLTIRWYSTFRLSQRINCKPLLSAASRSWTRISPCSK